ncbi:MAG: ATP-binding protein [Chloroflexota bacterium]|nr:ATP-binding protein [Chloroflexota bacterium]
MTELPNDFLNLLARPPGDIFYFLLVLVVMQASFFMALGQRMRLRNDRAATRYVLATLGAVLAWAAVMLGLIVAVLTNQPANAILPPLERAAQAVSVLLLGWAFLTADHTRATRVSNLVALVLLWGIIIGYVATGVEWSAPGGRLVGFNQSQFNVPWSAALVALAALGTLLTILFIRVVVDAPIKVIFFALIGFGSVVTLMGGLQGAMAGDYAGVLRLAFLGAMLIVPAVLYRMVVTRLEAVARLSDTGTSQLVTYETGEVPVIPTPSEAAMQAARDESLANRATLEGTRDTAPLMKALGMMLEKPDPDHLPEQVVAAAMNIMKADVGALLTLQDANYADVQYSYNKLMARPMEPLSVSLASQPTLVNAIERRTQRPLLPDRNVEELVDLYTRFDIMQTGPTYFQPLTKSGEVVGVLMIGMPYTARELTNGEMETLKGIGIIGANLLVLSDAAKNQRVKAEGRIIQAMVRGVSPDEVEDEAVSAAWTDMHKQLEAAREQIVQLSRQVTGLKIELDDERSRVTNEFADTDEGKSVTGRILVLTEEQQRLIAERDQLNTRLRDAETKLASATASGDAELFQAMIDVLNREKDELAKQRDALQAQVAEVRATSGGTAVPGALREMLQRMSEEKARLEGEREQLQQRVGDMETQLSAFGVEGGASGLAALLSSLYDQQAQLQARYDKLKAERDALPVPNPQEVEKLKTDIMNLAADREAVTKQRDMLRTEKDELATRFEAQKEQRARLMAEAAAYQRELTDAHLQQAQIRVQLQKYMDERTEFARERDTLLAEKTALQTERDQLYARVEGDRERLQQVGVEGVGSLTSMIDDLSKQRTALERDLHQAQSDVAALQNELELSRIQASSKPAPLDKNLADQLFALVQELRTPMTSIIGYADLVLGESAGILGDMQRKFMLRVSSNVKRLWNMTDDLHWLTVVDTGRLVLNKVEMDMVGALEDAVTHVATQLREKELALQLDLDDDLPLINADPEVMNEVIGQLLTNAYLASNVGGTIAISARHQRLRLPRGDARVQPVDALVVAVADAGGGIAAEDQPFVFSRRYKLENPLIPGLGDTGVGMAIARTLVEAHGGDIWFETGSMGTTFFFALPY